MTADTEPRLIDRHEGRCGDWVEVWEHTVTRACGCVEVVQVDHYPQRSVDHGPRHLEQMESSVCDTCLDMEEHA